MLSASSTLRWSSWPFNSIAPCKTCFLRRLSLAYGGSRSNLGESLMWTAPSPAPTTSPWGVHAPETEISAQPFGGMDPCPLRECANCVEALPGILLLLEPLDALRFRFLHCLRHRQPLGVKTKN